MTAARLLLLLAALLAAAAPARAHEGLGQRLARLEARLSVDPRDLPAHRERVRLLREAGRLQEADAALGAARAAGLEDDRLALERAMVAEALGRDDEALRAFARADAAGRSSAAAEDARARLLLRRGDRAGALAARERAAALAPTPDRFLSLARLRSAGGELRAAGEVLERGLAALGPTEVLDRALVELQLEQGEHARALERIDGELARRPERADWTRLRALALAGLGRLDEAAAARDRALALAREAVARRPTAPHLIELAEIHALRGEARAAREARARAARLTPGE
ncbi:MAG: hypothetical protein P1V51_02390 [Deltaproteobacteria bacterium]|nr:hypothetical protein [Deltaproteobacteria bacterium]